MSSSLLSLAGVDPSKSLDGLKDKATSAVGNAANGAVKNISGVSGLSSIASSAGFDPSKSFADLANSSGASDESDNPLSSTDPKDKGSEARQEAANDVMCSEFQSLFIKNQTRYQEFIMRSLENYFQEKHTKGILDKMLTRNMSEYIKSNQFSGIVKSEIEKSIGSVMQTSLRSGLRSRKNYQKMCNDINKMVAARGGGRAKRNPKKKTIKRRN